MLRVYFGTNVYDRVDKNDVPEPELLALRDALKQGKVIVHAADIEEMLGDWDTRRLGYE